MPTDQKIISSGSCNPSPGDTEAIWDILKQVYDPEIPVLSIVDLGIVRSVEFAEVPINEGSSQNPPSGGRGAVDLGIVPSVELEQVPTEGSSQNPPSGGRGAITITPTYSGCPAMDVIAMNIRFALLQNGYTNIAIQTVLSPAWTTDWMSESGKLKLKAYGIAPPNAQHSVCDPRPFQAEATVQCPRCNSYHTEMVSRFGSTACKALYRCIDCKEPFDYFKCH